MKTNGNWNGAIKNLLAAINVASPEQFSIGGRTFPVHGMNPGHAAHAGHNHQSQAHPLVLNLGAQLYEHAYSRPFRNPLPEAETLDFSPDAELIEGLSVANATRERWEHGWIIGQLLQHGQIMAHKGSQRRSLWPGQFLSKDGPASMPRPGAEISIFYAKESRSLQSGFYYAFGEAAEDETRASGLVRLYWNVSADGAAKLISLLTSRLNRFHVPFRLKCATALSQFQRTDVAVVYLTKRYFRIIAELMLDVQPAVADYLDEDVPLFSKKIARGLSVAEDPGSGESFGQSRCRPLAESVWNCYLRGDHTREGRLKEFRRLLVAGGIDPKHQHLNAGSLDWYELPRELA
jgi:hypothetical protein